MPGLRGIGKTTLLSQVFALEKFLKMNEDRTILENIGKLDEKLYLDVSQLHAEKITLNDFFKFYEEIKGFHFDEIHFDEN